MKYRVVRYVSGNYGIECKRNESPNWLPEISERRFNTEEQANCALEDMAISTVVKELEDAKLEIEPKTLLDYVWNFFKLNHKE